MGQVVSGKVRFIQVIPR